MFGLRKCASRKLAELGLSEKSFSDHRPCDDRMIEKYTKGQSEKAREAGHEGWETRMNLA